MKLGVKPQPIPFMVHTTLEAEQLPNDSPPWPLSPVMAENLVEVLNKICHLPPKNPPRALKQLFTTTTSANNSMCAPKPDIKRGSYRLQ